MKPLTRNLSRALFRFLLLRSLARLCVRFIPAPLSERPRLVGAVVSSSIAAISSASIPGRWCSSCASLLTVTSVEAVSETQAAVFFPFFDSFRVFCFSSAKTHQHHCFGTPQLIECDNIHCFGTPQLIECDNIIALVHLN